MLSLGTVAMISNERKPVKAIKNSFSPLSYATNRPKMEKWLFPHLCTPMGFPKVLFHFLSGIMWWLKYRRINLKQEIGNSFNFFIIFLPFLAVFPKFAIFAHSGHFAHPPGSPLITSDPNL